MPNPYNSNSLEQWLVMWYQKSRYDVVHSKSWIFLTCIFKETNKKLNAWMIRSNKSYNIDLSDVLYWISMHIWLIKDC